MERFTRKHYFGRLLILSLLIMLIAIASAAPTVGAETSRLDTIMEMGVLKVGSTGDYKPFTYFDKEKGEFEGIDIDMAKSPAAALGVKLELVQTTWKNIVTDLVEGKYDVAMGGISKKLSRQTSVFFTIPYLETGKAPITLKENAEKFQTLEQIDQEGPTRTEHNAIWGLKPIATRRPPRMVTGTPKPVSLWMKPEKTQLNPKRVIIFEPPKPEASFSITLKPPAIFIPLYKRAVPKIIRMT